MERSRATQVLIPSFATNGGIFANSDYGSILEVATVGGLTAEAVGGNLSDGFEAAGAGQAFNAQANKWNQEPGNEGRYEPRVVKQVPAGSGARREILKWERGNASRLRRELDPARHLRP